MNLVFRDTAANQALEQIAEQTARDIWIGPDRVIHAEHRPIVDSGFVVNGYAANWSDVIITRTTRNARTVQGVTLQPGTLVTRRETHDATGNWLAFKADYAISEEARPRVYRNNVEQAVIYRSESGTTAGLVMVEDGSRDVYLVVGAAGQADPDVSDEFIIEYVPFVETDTLWVQDNNLIASRAARGNTSGRVEGVTDTAGYVTADGASNAAQAYLDRYRDQMEITFTTNSPDANLIAVGKTIDIDMEQPFVRGVFVVTKYSMKDMTTFQQYRITAVGPEPFRVLGATNSTPIIITTELPHGIVDGQTVTVFGVEGNTAANVENWPVYVESPTRLRLTGLTGNGAYTRGGYLVVNLVASQTAIDSVTGDGTSPIEVTTTNPHGLDSPGASTYNGRNWDSFPTGSVSGVTGTTSANGTGRTLISTGTNTVTIGPKAPTPGIDIQSWSSTGVQMTIVTKKNHGLTTGNIIIIRGTSTADDGEYHSVTVTDATTLTIPSTVNGSGSTGTIFKPDVHGAAAAGSGSGVTVTSASPHGLTDSQMITITKATGFMAILQNWAITVTGASTFTLNDSSFPIYTGTSSDVLWTPWSIGSGGGSGSNTTTGGVTVGNVSTWSADGSTMTVTTRSAHGLNTGDSVRITASGADVDGTIKIATVTGPTTFTVTSGTTDTGTTGSVARIGVAQTTSADGTGLLVTLTTTQPHGLKTNDQIMITKATGFTSIEKNWRVTKTSNNAVTLQNSNGLQYLGSSSDVLWMPWNKGGTTTSTTVGSGTTNATTSPGPVLTTNFGIPNRPIVDVSIGTGAVTTNVPHGITTSTNAPDFPRVQVTGPTVESIVTAVTEVIDDRILRLEEDLSALSDRITDLMLRLDTASDELPERLGFGALDGPRQLNNVFRRLAGYRIRSVERATFVLAAAVPGYSASALQTGSDLTNAYTVVNNGVFRQVVVYFKSPPLGSAARIDIKKNGTTILSSPLVYPDGQSLPLRYNNFASLNLQAAKDDRLTCDVVAVGSQFAGCDATIHVLMGTL